MDILSATGQSVLVWGGGAGAPFRLLLLLMAE